MCCCERRRFDQFLPIPVCFSSGRVFFSVSSLPNAAPHSSGTPMSHHTPHKKWKPPERPPPFFGKFNPNRPGGRLSLRRIQLAVSHNPFEPKIGRSRLAGLSWGLTKRIASPSQSIASSRWGICWLLHSGREHCFHGIGAAGEGPTGDSISAGVAAPRSFHNKRGFPSPPLAAGFIGIVFLLLHCHMFLFFFFSNHFFFSSWMFLPAYTPFVVVVYCVVSNHNYVLACTVETTGRKDGIGSTSSGLGQALMNGSLAGNAKGIRDHFLGCIDRL
jgi:hypothetical protein